MQLYGHCWPEMNCHFTPLWKRGALQIAETDFKSESLVGSGLNILDSADLCCRPGSAV